MDKNFNALLIGLQRAVELFSLGKIDSKMFVLLIHDLMLVFDSDFESFRKFGSSADE